MNPFPLLFRVNGKNRGKGAALLEMRGRSGAIIRDVAAHFEAAGDFLGMIPFHAAAERKVRRTAKDQVNRSPEPNTEGFRKSASRISNRFSSPFHWTDF